MPKNTKQNKGKEETKKETKKKAKEKISSGSTELVVILDMSGSMYNLTEDTIGGFNSLIKDQKEDKDKVNVTLIVFNNEYHKLFDRVPVNEIPELTNKEYHPSATTALLDAIGKTISEMPKLDKDTKVMLSITTDGLENASQEYNRKTIKKMIEDKQKEGWEIIFVGANMDAVKEAGHLGIRADRSVNYRADSMGTNTVFKAMSETIRSYKKVSKVNASAAMDNIWSEAAEEIDSDYKNR